MKLVCLLTCAAVILLNHQTNALDAFLQHITVTNADEECQTGWFFGHKNCPSTKSWLVKHSFKLTDQKITEHKTSDIATCIDHCSKTTDCIAASVERQDTRCYLVRKGYNKDGNNIGWASAEAICCTIKRLPKVSTNLKHNLPIIFDKYTDCEPGTIDVTCPSDQKAWYLRETFGHEHSIREFPYAQRLECLNKCLDDPSCGSIDDSNDVLSESCRFFNYHTRDKVWKERNSLSLECCTINNKMLWKGRQRNLPILYDPKKMCISHVPLVGQACEIRVWMAMEGAIMENPYETDDNIKGAKMTMCLNYCLKNKECVGVAIRLNLCYFYRHNNSPVKYGYYYFTLYRLFCCVMK